MRLAGSAPVAGDQRTRGAMPPKRRALAAMCGGARNSRVNFDIAFSAADSEVHIVRKDKLSAEPNVTRLTFPSTNTWDQKRRADPFYWIGNGASTLLPFLP